MRATLGTKQVIGYFLQRRPRQTTCATHAEVRKEVFPYNDSLRLPAPGSGPQQYDSSRANTFLALILMYHELSLMFVWNVYQIETMFRSTQLPSSIKA